MTAPSSPAEFDIPSLHDGTKLQCRIFHPQPTTLDARYCRGAIMAHPYAPLGGGYDDPVVAHVVDELLDAGFVTCTFNFHGSRPSGGKTSWTAKPEVQDYVSCAGMLLLYLQELRLRQEVEDGECTMVFGGYSYGSMVTALLPHIGEIAGLFSSRSESGATSAQRGYVAQIKHVARVQGVEYFRHNGVDGADGASTGAAYGDAEEVDADLSLSVTPRYLLLSPVLPPVTTFLAPLSRQTHQLSHSASTSPDNVLVSCDVLAMFGDKDVFASVRKLRSWADAWANASSRFRSREIAGAGHLWNEPGTAQQMRQTLKTWLQTGVT